MMYFAAICFVLLFIAIEFGYAVYSKRTGVFHYENSISNISIGICERLINLFMAPLFFFVFQYLYDHYAFFHISTSWYMWVVLLLLTDFVWYWYHRLGHEVNLFWAAHIVHHQSDDFNLSVAARITVFQAWLRTLFWCILPVIGFQPEMVTGILIFHGTYSFFTHTQLIGKLGFLEHILITPSHHRVHHACNEKYLDKNYGDVFVFWDQLFGTFQRETEKPVYGLTHPLKSHSFLWQHFHYYAELFATARTKKSVTEKISVWFQSPAKMDPSIRPVLEAKLLRRKKRPVRPVFKAYVSMQIILALALLGFFSFYFDQLRAIDKTEYFVSIVLTLIITGAVIEQKRWVYFLELFRVGQFMLYGYFFLNETELFRTIASAIAVILLILPVKGFYFKSVFRIRNRSVW